MLQKGGSGKDTLPSAFWHLTKFFFFPPFLSKLVKEAIKQARKKERLLF